MQNLNQVNSAGIISTVAGSGSVGYSGDGGQAVNAGLNNPRGVALSTAGDIYIADSSNNRVRKVLVPSILSLRYPTIAFFNRCQVNSVGIISTFAGTGTAGYSGDGSVATLANLYNPCAVVVTASGDVLIADSYNSIIRKVGIDLKCRL